MKKDLYIKLLEFGDSKPNGFTYNQFTTSLSLTEDEKNIINKYFNDAWLNPGRIDAGNPPRETPFLILKPFNNYQDTKNIYILTIEAKFK